MTNTILPDNKFLELLRDCSDTLKWLQGVEPISLKEIPNGHMENVKRLEKVGIVFMRNRVTAQLRRQRLRRITDQVFASVPDLSKLGMSKSDYARKLGLGFLASAS